MNEPHGGHLAEERIQTYLDRQLSEGEMAGVRAHLDRCAACRAEIEAWRGVFARLTTLPDLEPSPGFAEGVMAEIEPELAVWRGVFEEVGRLGRLEPSAGFADAVMARVEIPGRATVVAREPGLVRKLVQRLRPKSWKGWTLAGGVAAAPAAALAFMAVTLFSRPLLTPSYLAAFLWWQVSGAVGRLFTAAAGSVMQSPLLFQAWEAVRSFAGSPTLAAGSLLGFSLAMLAALWILYRNLISRPPAGRRHAHVSLP